MKASRHPFAVSYDRQLARRLLGCTAEMVANSGYDRSRAIGQRAERNVNGQLAAILSAQLDAQISTHRPLHWVLGESVSMLAMRGSLLIGHKILDLETQ